MFIDFELAMSWLVPNRNYGFVLMCDEPQSVRNKSWSRHNFLSTGNSHKTFPIKGRFMSWQIFSLPVFYDRPEIFSRRPYGVQGPRAILRKSTTKLSHKEELLPRLSLLCLWYVSSCVQMSGSRKRWVLLSILEKSFKKS